MRTYSAENDMYNVDYVTLMKMRTHSGENDMYNVDYVTLMKRWEFTPDRMTCTM